MKSHNIKQGSNKHRRGDRVKPVLNLMLYWGKKKWERPLSLCEMTDDISALPLKLQQLAGDYKVRIIHMRQITEKALQEMDSDLKYVLGIMKCTKSSREYETYIRKNGEYFSRIPKSAVDVIDACTNIKDIRKHLRFVLNENSNWRKQICVMRWTRFRGMRKRKESARKYRKENIKEYSK